MDYYANVDDVVMDAVLNPKRSATRSAQSFEDESGGPGSELGLFG